MSNDIEIRACYVGTRFVYLGTITPDPGSEPRTCDSCGADDVIFGPREVASMADQTETYEILCSSCALPHMARQIAEGSFDLDTSSLTEEELELFKPLIEDPALFLGAAILAEKKKRERSEGV